MDHLIQELSYRCDNEGCSRVLGLTPLRLHMRTEHRPINIEDNDDVKGDDGETDLDADIGQKLT